MGYTLQGTTWVLSEEKSKETKQTTPHNPQAEPRREQEQVVEEEAYDEISQGIEAGEGEERREEEATVAEEETEPIAISPTLSQTSIKTISSLKSFIIKSLNKLQSHLNSHIHTLTERLDKLKTDVHFKLNTIQSLIQSTTHQVPSPKGKMKGVIIHSPSHSTSSSKPIHHFPTLSSPTQPSTFPSTSKSLELPLQPTASPHRFPSPQQTQPEPLIHSPQPKLPTHTH